MKYVSKLFLSICLVMGLGAAIAATAQIESDATIEANVPHPFVVGDTTLPAGKYTVKSAGVDESNALEIRSADGGTAVFALTENTLADRVPSQSELVFDKIGDQYFLSQVILEGEKSGSRLSKSRMQQKLEANGLQSERHAIAVNKKGSNQSAKRRS